MDRLWSLVTLFWLEESQPLGKNSLLIRHSHPKFSLYSGLLSGVDTERHSGFVGFKNQKVTQHEFTYLRLYIRRPLTRLGFWKEPFSPKANND